MRLIATMGASGIKQVHEYRINNQVYKSKLSFLALAEAYNIEDEDIVVIGTEKSKESIQPILDSRKNIKMVVIESSDVEDVFQKSLEYIAKDTILDLTQGYRHYPMLTLLASVFLQNNASKNIKDIFYAQIDNEDCQPFKDSCSYTFVSLLKYLDISNMVRIINTFNKTLLTLDYDVYSQEFHKVKSSLDELTQELFSNNFEDSFKKAKDVEYKLLKIISDKELDIIKESLNSLCEEVQSIQSLKGEKESQTLLNVSEYFSKKGILLHSITLLYEAMVAYLDENVNNKDCNTFKNKKGKIVKSNTFQRRNCLKKNLNDCSDSRYENKISKCQEFSRKLRKVDELRNTSAHGHTTGTYHEDLLTKIEETIKFLRDNFNCFKQNILCNSLEFKGKIEEQIMPNGEVRKVKKLKKRLVQTDKDKQLLKEGANQLADIFNNR